MSPPLETTSVTLVVTAEYHNPSILNHDFLLKNRIVDDSWGDPSDIVSVPAFSSIKYARQSIEISCQEERLQFQKHPVTPGEQLTDLVSCASAYVNTLPHVPYRAFGVNCIFNCTVADPITWMKTHFLAPNIQTKAQDAANFRVAMRYKVSDGTLTLEFRDVSPEETVVRIYTSYQQVLASTNTTIVDAIRAALDRKSLSEGRAVELIGS
jgi:hypothetical protein